MCHDRVVRGNTAKPVGRQSELRRAALPLHAPFLEMRSTDAVSTESVDVLVHCVIYHEGSKCERQQK